MQRWNRLCTCGEAYINSAATSIDRVSTRIVSGCLTLCHRTKKYRDKYIGY